MTKFKPYLIEYTTAALISCLLAALMFAPIFWTDTFIYEGDLTGSDLLDMNLPFRYLAAQAAKNFSLPMWISEIGCGFPLLAEGQAGVFYPSTLPLFLLFSIPWADNLSIISSLAIAIFGGYVLGRVHGLSRISSTFVGITIGFGPTLVFRIKHLNMVQVGVWFPISVAAIKITFDAIKQISINQEIEYERTEIQTQEESKNLQSEVSDSLDAPAKKEVAPADDSTKKQKKTDGSSSAQKGKNSSSNIAYSQIGSELLQPISRVKLGILLLAICWTMMIFAGHPHVAYVCGLAGVTYVIVMAFCEIMRPYFDRVLWQTLAAMVVSVVISVCLGAVQLLPTYELTTQSSRGHSYTWKQISEYPVTTCHLKLFLNPFEFGNPGDYKKFPKQKTYGKIDLFWEDMPYIGLTALFLLPLAFIRRHNEQTEDSSHQETSKNDATAKTNGPAVPKSSKSNMASFLTATATSKAIPWAIVLTTILLLILACGGKGKLYWIPWRFCPGFDMFRYPARFLIPFGTMAALWAGFGADALLSRIPSPVKLKYGRLSIGLLLCMLAFANFAWTTNNYVSYLPNQVFREVPETVDILKGHSRIAAPYIKRYWKGYVKNRGWRNAGDRVIDLLKSMTPDSSSFWGVKQSGNRTCFEGGSCLQRYQDIQRYTRSSIDYKQTEPIRFTPKTLTLFKLQNVSHFLAFEKAINGEGEELPLIRVIRWPSIPRNLRIYKLNDPRPRAYLVPRFVEDEPQRMSRFYRKHNAIIDSGDTCVFYVEDNAVRPGKTSPKTSLTKKEYCHIVTDEPMHLELDINTEDNRAVLFTENKYSCWQATLDGNPVDIYRTNYAFMGCVVPPGRHTLRFDFVCSTLRWGALLGVLGLIAFVGLSVNASREIRAQGQA